MTTVNDRFSGDHYSGNDHFSGPKPPDDAILFTVSGNTVIADKKLQILMYFLPFLPKSIKEEDFLPTFLLQVMRTQEQNYPKLTFHRNVCIEMS